ncbi:MAG: MBOAT family O-acyltransferase [Anaerolineales bacterium]
MDISWIGFSYIAFRLIHVLRDRITGRLPEIDLAELITYIIFFPTITAGPIDRIQRFIEDLRADFTLKSPQIILGGKRILIGLFKKFALADSLALIALNPQNAVQVTSTGWTWIMLYAYSFRIYYDFSGYTDIALGIGQLLGFSLPENFNRSYLQTNLTTFWNNWHMTLTNWFRAYFFNPLTRAMRTSKRKLPLWLIIFVAQLSTMVLIGLWHGITWNFVIWGFWHGVGLFIHNRWADLTRPILKLADKSTGIQRLVDSLGVLLTFNYVSLGWLWFVLPNPEISIQVFQKLIGI